MSQGATDLPPSWLALRLGDVVTYGSTEKTEPDDISPETWVLELEDVERDSSRILRRLSFAERQSKSTKNRFAPGDVLYGKLRPYLNKVVYADAPGVCTTEIVPIKPGPALVGRFLFHWLRHPEFLRYVTEVSHGVNMPRLGTDAGAKAPFVLAPLREQQRIADKLDTVLARVDACRDRLARVAPLLKRFRQSVLAAATSGRLTEHWRHKAGASIQTLAFEKLLAPEPGALKRGPFGSSIKKAFFVASGYKVYEQKNAIQDDETLGTYFLDESKFEELRDFAVAPGDFIVSCAGTIGRISQLSKSATKGVINQALMRIRIDEKVVRPRYFRLLFEAPWFQAAILEKTQGSAMQNMAAVKVIKQVPVELPGRDEQDEIIRRVEALFAFADRLEARLAQAQTAVDRLTPSLLAKAFRGELVPQDPADEPAAELLRRLHAEVADNAGAVPVRRRAHKRAGAPIA
ncbi:restriction endonuclease subunit S [Rubrivivax rivuli]|uniref:Type I restriction modification DNA specificity domain-containing protein n=1 Tax=Rubrivivax rivuli TaxID=1862385 RepID=A0A437RED3_9BURK|nr:restriction endonuclease subunit S [Rubrivivax rivuli]RVU45128.1 hypothetical protein EOE66_13305 [Rubrivivax rivuli]